MSSPTATTRPRRSCSADAVGMTTFMSSLTAHGQERGGERSPFGPFVFPSQRRSVDDRAGRIERLARDMVFSDGSSTQVAPVAGKVADGYVAQVQAIAQPSSVEVR